MSEAGAGVGGARRCQGRAPRSEAGADVGAAGAYQEE